MSIKELLSTQRLFFFCLAVCNHLIALPSGGEVIQGHATFISSSEALQVNANGKAILNWEQFNIDSHEAVRFVQSQETQAILNRVISGSASEILGSLQANCPIYLINPNGVFIGSSACIETAGFLASTADLSNEAFWQGAELLFQEFGNGRIVNLGKIHAGNGDVFLIARAGVDNQGSIEAPNGIAMLTTREMMLHPDTKECVFIRVSDAAEEGIQNSGTIQALAVELQTQSPYEKAIQHSGSIEALSISEQNGRIYLVAENSGGTSVSGLLTAKSGEVRVLGQTVVLEDGAMIDASGEFGGGTVLIGGDYQGKNEEIKNAKHTWVGKETLVRADALENGNGGKVIVWSNEATSYAGTISACGGALGGDGGFVEVSGKKLLFDGMVSTAAPFGNIGTLLLDPTNVTISTVNSGGSFSACAPPITFTPDAAATDTIAGATLVGLLNTCNVTISTVGSAGGGTGAITISNAITGWTAATTLTLTAASFISISAAVTNTSMSTGFTAMNFTANGMGATTNPGITLAPGGILTTTGGNVTLSGTSAAVANGSHGVSILGGRISTGSGNISVTGVASPGITANAVFGILMQTVNGIGSSSGNITLSGTTNTSGTSGYGVNASATWDAGTTGTITFQNCVGGIGSNNYGIVFQGGTFFSTRGNIIATNNIHSGLGSSGGGFFIGTPISSDGGNIQITAAGLNNGIVMVAGGLSTTGNITLIGTGTAVSVASNGINLLGGTLSSPAGSITLNGTGGASSAASPGINLAGGQVTTTGGAAINCTGTGGSGTGGGYGVFLTGSNSLIQTADGLLSATGNGGGTGANAGGIGVFSSARFNVTGTGGITLNGTASPTGGTNSHGIVVDGSGSAVTTVSGTITVNGTGSDNAASTDCNGLQVSTSGKINSTSGFITGDCSGGAGITGMIATSGCNGIFVTGSGSLITTATGSGIDLTGRGRGTTTLNRGISLATIGSITTTTNAPITLEGEGSPAGISSNEGIFLTGSLTRISTATGAIQLTGTAGGGTTNGITIDNGAAVLTTTSGNIGANATGGLALLAGAAGSAQMATTNGNINVTASDLLVLTGSTAASSFAQMTVGNAANTVMIQSLGIDMDAGTGSGAFAEISSNGGLITIDGAGPISLNGNNNTNTYAQIITKTTVLTTATPAISIGQNTPPTSITLQGGSGGTLARAVIATDTGGSIFCSTSGSYTITGGGSANDSRAGFYTGLGGSGSGNITLSGTDYLLTGGASGAGTNFARISTPSTGLGGFINLTSTSGVITLQGGGGTNAPAQILTNGTGDITISAQGAISLFGSNGVGATNALAAITTSNGDIDLFTTGLLTLTGGSQSTGTSSQIAVGNSANTVAIESAGISMTGGATPATGAFAEIAALGGLISIDGIGPISLTGGSNATSPAQIINRTNIPVGDAISIGSITLPTTLTLQGGLAADGAPAYIVSDVGGNIVCNTSEDWTITGGSSGTDASAGIITGFTSGSGDITTTSAGAISITGGSGTGTNYAGLFTGLGGGSGDISLDATSISLTGGSNTGTNYANIATSSGGGSITVVTSGGPNILQGGTGDVADAQIITNGTGNIDFTGVGDFSALGGTGASSFADVNAQGTLTINIGAGDYLLRGDAGDSSFARFTATGAVDLIGGDYTLTGGASGTPDGSNAVIESTGITGLVTLVGAAVTLNGGTAADQHSYIQTTAGTGPNPITITSQALMLNGSVMMGATNATAEILSSFGNIAITSSGPIELQGGSQVDTAVRIAVSPGTNVDTIAIEMQGLTLNGGSAAGALAEITSPGGVISIDGTTNVMSGAIELTADAADAIIHTSGAPMGANAILIGQAMSRAPPTAITLQGGMTGTSSRAIISSDVGGDILSTSSGAYSITGGTGDVDSRAGFYTGLTSGSGSIALTGTSYSLTGGLSGMGYNSAEILSGVDGGAITLTSNTSALALLARDATTSDARIATQDGDAILINTISSFSATGGNGDSARAIVATDAGGNITVSSTSVYTITGGGSTGNSYAGIYSALSGGTGTINLSGTSYNLTGGSNTGTNRAEISTGAGSITIASSSGNSILQGGAGSTSDARIITNGAGNIDFTGVGNVSLLGGVGTSSVAEINALGILTATVGSGNYILTGGGAGSTSSLASFTATGTVNMTGNNYTLTGGASGTADGSNALIQSTGAGGLVSLVGGTITLNGGTAANQHSYIQTTAGSGLNPIAITCGALNLNGSGVSNGSAEVRTVFGDIDITASGDITLTGGSASLAAALIQSTTQGELTLNAQNFIVEAGSVAGSSGVITQSGDISITCTQNASLFATVPNALAVVQTLGSDLTMSVGGSINLVGASLSTPAPVGNLLLIAGVDITIDGTTEVTALGTMTSSLTLVVDNNFSTPPGIGPGAFILDAGGILSTEPGMPLKIYTAVRDQNTVNSPINGVPFIPGTLGVNTSTEEWEVYYPGGSYEGAAFKFYYKTTEIPPPPGPSPSPVNPREFFDLIAANLVELVYLLPILDVNWKHYHFQLCEQDRRNIYCSPTFSPYGSFIFEDDVYWVGTGF